MILNNSKMMRDLKKKIYEFESIEHPVHKFIAASPDGITEDGELVEYKKIALRLSVFVSNK